MHHEIKTIENHIVLLGWSERTSRLINALRTQAGDTGGERRPILVITPSAEVESTGDDRIYFLFGSPSDPQVLAQANLSKAHLLLIPADDDGELTPLLTLLGILAQATPQRICIELSSAHSSEILTRLVESGALRANLEILSCEQMSRCLLRLALEMPGAAKQVIGLLDPAPGASILRRVALPTGWSPCTFRGLSQGAFNAGAILLGFSRGDSHLMNPSNREETLVSGDVLWLIAPRPISAANLSEAVKQTA